MTVGFSVQVMHEWKNTFGRTCCFRATDAGGWTTLALRRRSGVEFGRLSMRVQRAARTRGDEARPTWPGRERRPGEQRCGAAAVGSKACVAACEGALGARSVARRLRTVDDGGGG